MGNENRKKRVYTVATAHLDTIWNWDLEYVISKCIPKTLKDNFRLFELFDSYKFNFEGAYRYELMEEYYPELFEKLKDYVLSGRWSPCGSSYENGDVNVPSPEALMRNILIGNSYFEEKFGIRTNEIFLPDCFGFGYALPSVASHMGLKGFTTQKLSWGSAYGNPFDVGVWRGVDGKSIFAVLQPGSYITDYSKKHYVKTRDLHNWDFVKEKLSENEKYGLDFTVSFQGTGDQGGSPSVGSVRVMDKAVKKNPESAEDVSSEFITSVFDELSEKDEKSKSLLPEWNNELVMTFHGAGGYTSRAIGKRWNSHNELLADRAERMSVIAASLGARDYPQNELNTAWKRVIAHHFHDDLPGTSVQREYKRSWNDLAVSINQFENEYVSSVGAVTGKLNTAVAGRSVVVNNPLEFSRREAVTAQIESDSEFIHVFDDAEEIPSQTRKLQNGKTEVVFIADMAPMSLKVFSFRDSDEEYCAERFVSVSSTGTDVTIDNGVLRVTVNEDGNIASVYDIPNEKETLASPIKFDIYEYFGSTSYPAWEILYNDISGEPNYEAKLDSIEIVESGPVRGSIKIKQSCDGSVFEYTVSLSAFSERVEVDNEVEWRGRHRLLKVRFPFMPSNENALYDLGLGAISRGNNTENLYEVPAQKWVDLTDFTGEYGVSVFSDCKYGWDKPDNTTLRLTVVHTPMLNYHDDSMQSMMDLGLNRFSYAIYPHAERNMADIQKQARCFTYAPAAFEANCHDGALGSEYSFLSLDNPAVIVRAVKRAEKSDKIIVRVNEGAHREQSGVRLKLGDGILSAEEVNGFEDYIGEATVENGSLVFDMKPYEVKTFAITLKDISGEPAYSQKTVELPFDIGLSSYNGDKNTDDIGGIHYTVPAEQFPREVYSGGVIFDLGLKDGKNAMLSNRQRIELPEGAKRLHILACELYGDREEVFEIGINTEKRTVAAIDERVAGWDLYDLGETAFIKNDDVALNFTHIHRHGSDEIAKQSYVFKYTFDVSNEKYFTFPKGETMLVLGAAVSFDENDVELLTGLSDRIEKRDFDYSMSKEEKKNYRKYKIKSYFKS